MIEDENKRIQTIEKHDAIYRDFCDLQKQLNEEDPEKAKQLSMAYRYKKIADKYFMTPKAIYKIIRAKLNEGKGKTIYRRK